MAGSVYAGTKRATKSAACICYNNKMVPLLYAWWPRLTQHVELLIRSHTRLRLDLNTEKYGYYSVLKLTEQNPVQPLRRWRAGVHQAHALA